MKRIGILTSGGDAPGMNACIRAVVRTAMTYGIETLGIRRGYLGLINGDMNVLDRQSLTNILPRGGTILETTRCPEFTAVEGRAKAIKVLKGTGIEGLVLLGGDGTFHGGTLLANECDVSIIGVPTTIDNDVYGTDYTVGFDTAVNTAIEAIDRIRDTAMSHERLFFVEVMGHHTGFIALESGIAGGAEEMIIPEVTASKDVLWARLQTSFDNGKKSAIVVVAEGDRPGHTFAIAQEAKDKLKIESRVCILGHVQRGGSPTARDRVLASNLGSAAIQALMDGKKGCMIGEVKREIVYTELADTWGKKKELYPRLVELAGHTFSVAKEEIITDTNAVDRLILIGIGLVVIGIGAVITYAGNYLATPEHKKQMVAKLMRIHGVIFVALGLAYLIYCIVALRG